MPDKRQTSKQRRAARNRASREALAARRENAVINPPPSSRSSAGKGRAGAAPAGGAAGGSAAASEAEPQSFTDLRLGDIALLFALAWSVGVAILLPLLYQVPVDDRGEPLPTEFRGLAVAAREQVTGQTLGDESVSLFDASGPAIFIAVILPVFVCLFALWGNRRQDRSRMLTFSMIAMAGAVILTGGIGIFFFPALIAMAVAGFRVRRADLPARMAERATAGGRDSRGRGRVVDADSREVDDADEVVDDEVDDIAGDGPQAEDRSLRSLWTRARRSAATDDEVAEEPPADEVEYDPLAELEAEIEAEQTDDTDAPDRGDAPRG